MGKKRRPSWPLTFSTVEYASQFPQGERAFKKTWLFYWRSCRAPSLPPPKKNRLPPPPPHIHFPLYCSCVRRSRGEKRKENYLGKISWAEKRRRKGTNLVHSVSMPPPPPPPPPPKAPQSTFKSSDGMGWEEVGSGLGRVRINSDCSYFFTCGETVRS